MCVQIQDFHDDKRSFKSSEFIVFPTNICIRLSENLMLITRILIGRSHRRKCGGGAKWVLAPSNNDCPYVSKTSSFK